MAKMKNTTDGSLWDDVVEACQHGQLMKLLDKLPRERWGERDAYGCTLLHYAVLDPNVEPIIKLLRSGLINVNERDTWNCTTAQYAANYIRPRALEILCAAGADLRACNELGDAPIDEALKGMRFRSKATVCVHVLVANGVRLSTARETLISLITPELKAFERGVLKCRKAIIAMLRIKKAAKLWWWDKYLLREIGFAIWSTRYDNKWSIL